MRPRVLVLAVAAGLALADASVVTLALPELLVRLDTTVGGVAAVIGVYAVVLAAALLPAAALVRVAGAVWAAAGGAVVFAVGSAVCAGAGALGPLLVGRGVQAVGAAGLLAGTFALLAAANRPAGGRAAWRAVAVLAVAAGPPLGGALTQAFDWRAIFLVQVPVALLAVPAAVALGRGVGRIGRPGSGRSGPVPEVATAPGGDPLARAALALVAAALTAVLFALVLLLVAGWAERPLTAAVAVCVLPLAALVGSRIGGPARTRAACGCALVALGTAALAVLPRAELTWTVLPQLVAGLGMGLALRALSGELLPERTTGQAAGLLALRHVGIAVALAVLAPVTAARLDDAIHDAREQGVAVVLDARLPPQTKLELAPALLAGVEADAPRAGLREAIARERPDVDPDEAAEVARLGARTDGVVVDAVGRSFAPAFLIAAACALLAALALVLPRPGRPRGRGRPGLVVALPLLAVGTLAVQVGTLRGDAPAAVRLADPCVARSLPDTGGVTGFLQDQALRALDRGACRYGSSREELVLALADEQDARAFQRAHGVDPRSASGLLEGLLG